MKMNTAVIVSILVAVAFGLFYLSQREEGSTVLDPKVAKKQVEKEPGIVIDVRTAEEHASGHLKKARHNFDITSGEFASKLDSLDKSKTYYLYCRSGNRSGKATDLMLQNGFRSVYNIGGYQELVDAGLESTK